MVAALKEDQQIVPQPLIQTPVIELDGLSVHFGKRPILQDLRGQLRGRAIGLLGPNGAGKTTLIHTLLGFHPPSSGNARIFGEDIISDKSLDEVILSYLAEDLEEGSK